MFDGFPSRGVNSFLSVLIQKKLLFLATLILPILLLCEMICSVSKLNVSKA